MAVRSRAEVLDWVRFEDKRLGALAVEAGETHRIHPSRESRRAYVDATFAYVQALNAQRALEVLGRIATSPTAHEAA